MGGTTAVGTPGFPRLSGARPPCQWPSNRAAFDVESATVVKSAAAKAICRPCPARVDCLRFIVDHPQPYGVFAGLTPGERKQLGPVDDPAETVRRLHDVEALAAASRFMRQTFKRPQALAAVGVNDLERGLLILRHAPHLARMVADGWLSLAEAALQADPDGRPDLVAASGQVAA